MTLAAEIEKRLFILAQKLARTPSHPVLHNQLGLSLGAAGRVAEALAAFQKALALCPTYGEAWMNAGLAQESLDDDQMAFACYSRAGSLTPLHTEAVNKVAALAIRLGKEHPEWTWIDTPPSALKKVLNRLRRKAVKDASETELRLALEADRTDGLAAGALGTLLVRQERLIEAELFLRYALLHEPANCEAAITLAGLLENLHRPADAATVIRKALQGGATDSRIWPLLLRLQQMQCDWSEYDSLHEHSSEALNTSPGCSEPFPALMLSSEPRTHLLCAKAFAVGFVHPSTTPPKSEPSKKKLIIGYISADFHQHPVATLAAELFALHDRNRFEVVGYALWTDDGGNLRRRIRGGCDRFVDLWGISASAAVDQIQGDGVDILVDLTGYTHNARVDILARSPAPIQINYLGYPGTMGASFMDYIIVDPIVAPPGSEEFFTEKLVRLPSTYQINDRQRPRPSPRKRAAYGLPQYGVVFCNFNGNAKLTPAVFDAWMRVLAQVPDSVLWLYETVPGSARNLRNEAMQRGVDADRLIFAKPAPYIEHLARYAAVDLFLDTLPYNAHTTASDALWMGCPVLTCAGQAFPGRVAASLLHAAGLGDLVAASLSDYTALAIHLGNSAVALTDLKQRLRVNRGQCTLFDTPGRTRQLEWAYEYMWSRYNEGLPIAHFNVPEV